MGTRILAILVAGLLVAASGCAQGNATRAPASATPTPGGSSGSGSAGAGAGSGSGSSGGSTTTPPPPAAAAIDAIGALDPAAAACHLFHADSGADYELTGPLVPEIEAKLGASGHPVHVTGAPATGACGAAPGVEVQGYSFTDGIYATKSIATGVTWRSHQFQSLFGAFETVNVLEVDVTQPGVSVRPVAASGGHVTSVFGKNAGARASLNGGYFDSSFHPTALLKIGGSVVALNPSAHPRAAIGFDQAGQAVVDWIPPGDSWAAVTDAVGAGPNLVTGGQPDVTPAQEGISSASFLGRNPRTAAGFKATGEVVLVTVDGRSSAGKGMTLDELATIMVLQGCSQAMNLDGGGSTTMWINGEPDDGVVNYPSDNGLGTHFGERRVGDALVIQAP